ncbi:hypothetical protein BJ170DRAFT_93467 [Xylariales sp. AK1849]|nr:hypothetical protein BJ170DRAFT_93467 [Xylariales sp. AK1849]
MNYLAIAIAITAFWDIGTAVMATAIPEVAFPITTVLATTYDNGISKTIDTMIERRTALPREPFCDIPGWSYGSDNYFKLDIDYLKSHKDHSGQPSHCPANPGPVGHGRCTRVACQNNAGIFVCNDLDVQVTPMCALVGEYADWIIGNCSDGLIKSHTQGQIFDTDGWNVILASEPC